MKHRGMIVAICVACFAAPAAAQGPGQPKVNPGPSEPDWIAILDAMYGLRMFDDLANPVTGRPEAVAGLFRKAGPGPVTYRPVIALGLEVPIRGGWYRPSKAAGGAPEESTLWSYQFKNTAKDIETGENLPPPLLEGSATTFDPGEKPFGLWVGNDQFQDEVYTEPAVVAARSPRLKAQPYKAMIYPYRDRATGQIVPHSYLIGWEYSTNDDFQDAVTRVDNVTLLPAGPGR